ncbi:MAG: valine--tRNA ligase [Candidatus Niyogibacteria bacterium]|nr:valine--tRNA ligase [Candidatus Niyogibacteria bacterium]
MKLDFSKPYDPKMIEDAIYARWEKSGYFNPDNLPPRHKKVFSMSMAPPNITGSLHMGHALEYTLSDVLIRFKRMRGSRTLWLPGTDHAGIATQNAVEKELRKEGVTRHQLGHEEFLKRVWQWKEKYGPIILNQLKKIGVSADWSRARFTMDERYQQAVAEAFRRYHEKGWIYRGRRVISWCPRCRTSLSDLELEYMEEKGSLWFIKYPFVAGGFITVATTRPETMLGDTAVAVHPSDPRYKNAVGKEAFVPIQERRIPVIADRRIEKEFGTGAVKITPAHDMLDAEIGRDHKLPEIQVIGEDGKMTPEAGPICAGLPMAECRVKVVQELENRGLIEKIEEHTTRTPRCYRCNSVIETLPSEQWFLKMDELAKLAEGAVKTNKVRFHPKRFEKPYLDWLKNINDWTLSRQIWWGHRIPIEGETDVLDTWFSSALWPFAALGWPEKTRDLKIFYPTNVLTNDRGIINLWDARMIYSGLLFTKKPPFRDVIIHGTILTKEGKRMSKSLGTGIDPLLMIERYGADATRFAVIWQAMGGQDIRWSEDALMAGKKFLNKLWNASRFVLSQLPATSYQLPAQQKPKTLKDKKVLAALKKTKRIVSRDIESYEFGAALHEVYEFFWHQFCDTYLEAAKDQLVDENQRAPTAAILGGVLSDSLKLLHPFIPHITEAIWNELPTPDKKLLIIESWPRS